MNAVRIVKTLTTAFLVGGVALLVLVWFGPGASSELPGTVVTGCDLREMVIIEQEPTTGQTLQEASQTVSDYIAISPSQLVVQTLSETEAEGAFPDTGEASLVIGFHREDSGWAATVVSGCPELVLTVDEVNGETES